MERLTIQQVAKELNMPEQKVRVWLQRGLLKGIVEKNGRGKRRTYTVFRDWLNEFKGGGTHE